ncbi:MULTISPECIES: hypothetical protein [Erwiniaceae]|uniref:Uncharacterized protein n=1 Tax=Erwinia rhapontici TaxID=55212 RepID=A0ABM7MUM1_ERWRD|nr:MULTISPECIES: hypothetical protein [Erwiniaceae]MBP2153596.1 hypothetical protein [Erwinia rhapontici]MCS3608663.1 hypothetical protein [Erwinia rhapontici]TDS98746.1 hypothetical protein EDF84_10582 [Erwinia rhapontici]BCQ32871.1 hypothetical protein ERHA53_02140 [Erwinia rhapontici]BCQ37634.1 hypothetical protein ERHA54_02370 [Erwinia rhapontici]
MSTFDLLDPQNTYDDVMDRVREHSGAYGMGEQAAAALRPGA